MIMTDEQINIAIAEACGWDNDDIERGHTLCQFSENVPDYCNDLNAMHEAEQFLWRKDWEMRDVFVDKLANILNPIHGYRNQAGIDLLDATACQRAEAFLRTIGKWKEQN